MSLIRNAFRRLHYPVDVIAPCVRGYLTYALSLRNLAEMMAGQTIDFLLTAKRDAAAVLRVFRKAIRHHGGPVVVTIDKSGANTAALPMLNADKAEAEILAVRQRQYLNNLVEQDHRNIKRRITLITGFTSFRRAQSIVAGIEPAHMIRKGQRHHPDGDGWSPALLTA